MTRIVALDVGDRVGMAVHEGALLELVTYGYYRQMIPLFGRLKYLAHRDTLFLIEEPRKGSARVRSRDLGRCHEKALTLQAWITAFGGKVLMVKPNKFTKLTAQQFTAYWPDWEGKSSNHSRDAGMIVWVHLKQRSN